MLVGEIRQRLTRQMQSRLGLTDAQMGKVREINMRFADRREMLMQQERDVRMSLRDEMITADSSRQQAVADLLDRMLRVQRQRLEIQEQEQRELATVLTPFQRATYIGFEEQVRQRMEQMRQQGGRMGPPPGGPPNGPPSGGPPVRP
jgi:Spy/CpxP family protein refolding chaperone